MHRADIVANTVEELAVWQLGNELRQRVYSLTATRPVVRDITFCNQVRDAATSFNRNISEGFGRLGDAEFAQFLAIASGSAYEVKDALHDGILRGCWSEEQAFEALRLCHRLIPGLARFIGYLAPTSSKRKRRT